MKKFLKPNDKYALLIIPGVYRDLPDSYSFNLASDTILTTKLEIPDVVHWKEWLGSILWKEIVEAGTYLLVKKSSSDHHTQNHEDQNLKDKAVYWWHILKVTGSFKSETPIILTGVWTADDIKIQSKSSYPLWYHQGDDYFLRLKINHLPLWKTLYEGYEAVTLSFRNRQHRRIVFGLRNFIHATELEMVNWRLPAFVRAIEAFVKPVGQGFGKQFARRAAFLTRDDKDFKNVSESVFTEIYNLRCDYDHLYDMAQPTESEWRTIITCEDVARRLYQRLLVDASFRDHFSDDVSIDAFWKNQNMEQTK